MRYNGSRLARATFVVPGLLLAAACGGEVNADAYGNFEAIEVVVSAQTTGQVLDFLPVEGMVLDRGSRAATIDTTQLVLERAQLAAQQGASRARRAQVAEQLRVIDVQRELALRDYERTQRLYAEQAATARQLERAEQSYEVLLAQMDAARAQLRSVEMEAASSDARVRQVDDLVDRSSVLNPQGGTVLATYTRAGETVQAGQPLYRIASLDTLILRVYVTGDQLGTLRLGQELDVHFEGVGGDSGRSGIVEWISPSAEFTPTPIQTRDERATLVYAVKVRVPNDDGVLKIGMPGDVTFRGGGPGGAGGEGGEGREVGAEVQAGEAGESSAERTPGAEFAEGVR